MAKPDHFYHIRAANPALFIGLRSASWAACRPGRRSPGVSSIPESPHRPRYRSRMTFGLLRIVLVVIAIFVALFLFRRIRLLLGSRRRR